MVIQPYFSGDSVVFELAHLIHGADGAPLGVHSPSLRADHLRADGLGERHELHGIDDPVAVRVELVEDLPQLPALPGATLGELGDYCVTIPM